jgi:RHS repeat-associated protein
MRSRVIEVSHIFCDDLLEIRNRPDRNPNSTGYVVRFKQLAVLQVTYDEHTIQYTYDALARLIEAFYDSGTQVYTYGFDTVGNLTNLNGASRTYNAANQMTNDGTNMLTYDNNGNLTNDGTNAYVWDRANRLLSMGGTSHQYDGDGHRFQQTIGMTITQYLLDVQPELSVMLSATTGLNTERYVHAPRGIHAWQDASSVWHWIGQDGLGSVRLQADNTSTVEGSRHFDPYGNLIGSVSGTIGTPYHFTGELLDGSGLLDLRARRYSSNLGVFTGLDPFEGIPNRPMSLNGYSWVEGNVANAIDPTGRSCVTSDCIRTCAGVASTIGGGSSTAWATCILGCNNQLISVLQPDNPAYCEQWPANDHPLVYRLCHRCRGGTLPDIKGTSESGFYGFSEAQIRETISISLRNSYSCFPSPNPISNPFGTQDCYGKVADIFSWMWTNGGDIGKRAVVGFMKGIMQTYYASVRFEGEDENAKGGVTLTGEHDLRIGGAWLTKPVDHKLASTLVHEMEHFYWDVGHSRTTFGEVRAYLSGYLYLLEVGYTNDQIKNEIFGETHPQWAIGNHFCHYEIEHPDQLQVFSRDFMEAARATVKGIISLEELRLPQTRAPGF